MSDMLEPEDDGIIEGEFVEVDTEEHQVVDMRGRQSARRYDPRHKDGNGNGNGNDVEDEEPAIQLRLVCQSIECQSGSASWNVRVPLEYEIWRDGVFKRKLATYNPTNPWPQPHLDATAPDSHRREHLDRVTYFPIFLQRTGFEMEWGRPVASRTSFTKLAFVTGANDLRQHWVATSMPSKVNEIINLSAVGADVTSANSRDIVAFLAAMRGENRELSTVNVVRRCGLYTVNHRPCWFLGRTWIGPMDNVDLDVENMTALKAAYGPRDDLLEFYIPGSKGAAAYVEWKNFVAPYLTHRDRGYFGRWIFGLSCLPPIAALITQRGFIAHMFAQSGQGKTTLGLLAMSGWGAPYPGQLWQSLDATRLGAMAKFEHHASHLPLLLDELQVSDQKSRDALIYSLVQGQGRKRVAVDGTEAETDEKAFLAIVMMTGEEGLIGSGKKDGGGQASRVVEIDVNSAAAYPPDMVRAVHPFLERRIYGFMGIDFLRYVSAATATPEQRGRFTQAYNELREEMQKRLGAIDSQIVQRMSSVAFAEYLMLLYCWAHLAPPEAANNRELLLKWARDLALEDAMRMYECTIASGRVEQARPLRDRALDALRAHYTGNPQLYPDLDTTEGRALAKKGAGGQSFVGFTRTQPGAAGEREVIYLTHELNRVCQQLLDMPALRIMNDFADIGWIRKAGSNHRVIRSATPYLPQDRYYVLPLARLAEDLALATTVNANVRAAITSGSASNSGSVSGTGGASSVTDETVIEWSFDPDATTDDTVEPDEFA